MKLVVVSTKRRDRAHPGYCSAAEWAAYNAKPRLYIDPVGETIWENLQNRRTRPYTEYKKLLPAIYAALGLPANTEARWSQRAGCSCPCSPGFVLAFPEWAPGAQRVDFWAEVADTDAPQLEMALEAGKEVAV